MTTGIYQLNFSNGTFYIGQAQNIATRYAEHIEKMRVGQHTKKIQRVFDDTGIVPTLEILVDCHEDFLDLFESFYIHKHKHGNILNTAIPKNRLSGATQRVLDTLIANRFHSLVNILDTLNSNEIHISELNISLKDATSEIEYLAQDRTQEELLADVSNRINEWRTKFFEEAADRAELEIKLLDINSNLISLITENKRLKSRGFFARLFNL